MPTHELVLAFVSAGIPASFVRLWWIWWTSDCLECGFVRKACTCPSHEHLMRPRR
jgi:hypothetical protein